MESPRFKPVYRCVKVRECAGCGWFRDVTTDPEAARTYIHHLVWGRVTVTEAANLDARHHDCDKHRAARFRLMRGLQNAA